MANIEITIPGFGVLGGDNPLVILGPNGSGKTKLAQRIAQTKGVTAISAQRRTWIEESLPVQREEQLKTHMRNQQQQWHTRSWHPTEDIDFVLSTLVQEHTALLTAMNEEAIRSNSKVEPLRTTKLMALQALWGRLFPTRKLEIGSFFPTVRRLDAPSISEPYALKQMSDGERAVLYMAGRLLTADPGVVIVDEPELHLHSRLAVQFWNEVENLRPDCRFVYVTHDLNFALSRRHAGILIAKAKDASEIVLVDALPAAVASEVLGAATLPFYAKRIFFFEGAPKAGFAAEFFSAWFADGETFAIAAGDRNGVFAAVSGLRVVGVSGAQVLGLVDRDHYPDSILDAVTEGVAVLQLHEIESILCDKAVTAALAEHLGRDGTEAWRDFLARVRQTFRGQTLGHVVAQRVRCRIGDLLDGAFSSGQISSRVEDTSDNHANALRGLDLPGRAAEMFTDEYKRVSDALIEGEQGMLALLPGKHLLSILSSTLGFKSPNDLTALVIASLTPNSTRPDSAIRVLETKLSSAFLSYLPPRALKEAETS